MSKLTQISLDELYSRKITSSVEAAILSKDDFSKQSPNWCEKVCKLNCKNPPQGQNIFLRSEVDVLIIQDYKAFDEPKFRKAGALIEQKHLQVIQHLALQTLRNSEGSPLSYSVTSLLKCQLQPADLKKGKAPSDTYLQKCRPYLLEEIRTRKPKVIISLSTSATKALGLKKHSNYTNRGEITATPEGIPLVITGHPRVLLMLRQNSSGKMWGPDFYSVILKDFEKAAALVNGTLRVPNLEEAIERAKKRIHIARSLKDVESFVTLLQEQGLKGKILSYDTETTGLDPYAPDAKLITVQFGVRSSADDKIDAYVFPLWHRNNIWYNPDEAWEKIIPILTSPDIKKIGHNVKFDIIYPAVTTGVRVKGVLFDTMLMLHAINSGLQGMYGLKRAVHDWIPESELGNYEDKLPKLTKQSSANDSEEEIEEEEVD